MQSPSEVEDEVEMNLMEVGPPRSGRKGALFAVAGVLLLVAGAAVTIGAIHKPVGIKTPAESVQLASDCEGCSMYLGNFPREATQGDVEEIVKDYGEITKVTIVRNPRTDESRGFAYVIFAKPEDAEAAVKELENAEYQGRNLKAHLEEQPSGRRPGGSRPGGSRSGPSMILRRRPQ